MANQLTSNAEALRLFFTEDVYLVNHTSTTISEAPVDVATTIVQPLAVSERESIEHLKEVEVVPISVVAVPQIFKHTDLEFKFLGKNEKQILILVNDAEHETSTLPGRELLRKLVQAIELTIKDFALVNYANYPTASYAELEKFFSCKLLLSFGVSAKQLALPENPLHTLITTGENKMIFTANLDDLNRDQNSKKMLWSNLQKLK